MKILQVDNLSKKYGDFTAVKGVSFSVERGEIFGFLGPNGAGKTTTINMLTGLARISGGSIEIAGVDGRQIKKAQKFMGIVSDESNLYDEMNGFQNLCFCGALYGMEKKAREKRARELLEQFDLLEAAEKPFKQYSKGMKRKLTIAAGIIHNPQLLFLDEPTTGIDVSSARQIRKLILDLNQQGTTIFLTTHYIEEAERLCQRIAFIVNGQIVRTGTIEELMRETQNLQVVHFSLGNSVPGIKELIAEEFADYQVELIDNNSMRIYSPSTIQLMPFMKFFEQNHIVVYEARIIKPSLEDVFVDITGIELDKMKKEKEKGGPGK